ncbi:hypothetical protein N8724_01440 [Candidatus Pelagibacter sp.]|nr:hypothetical protein [Candidatus Pelagibacter sp.]
MKIEKKSRKFKVGISNIILKEVAKISLKKNEIVTFCDGEIEYDVVKKNWGYYATPSINSRLLKFGLKTCIIKSKVTKNIFITLVQNNKKKEFNKYLKDERCKVIKWLS